MFRATLSLSEQFGRPGGMFCAAVPLSEQLGHHHAIGSNAHRPRGRGCKAVRHAKQFGRRHAHVVHASHEPAPPYC